jgi:hypothetical protein
MTLDENLFDIISTLKRAFSEFVYTPTKRGFTITSEDYEVEGIYQEIINKSARNGFKMIKPDSGWKYEFLGATGEMFKVSMPQPKRHSTLITLEFN